VAPRLGIIGRRVLWFGQVDSTNDLATSLAQRGAAEGTVVAAREQRCGRGRHGREWYSPPGAGLYVSVVLRPGATPGAALTLLTLAAGVAVAEGVQAATGLPVGLKWPNDVIVGPGRRKLAGILAEASTSGGAVEFVVLGIGVNAGVAAYPPALADRATSIELELGRQVDAPLVLAEILAALAQRYRDLREGRGAAVIDGWRARAPSAVGTPIAWAGPDGPCQGVTAGIDDQGALLVRTSSGLERLVAGDVEWA